MVTLRTHNWAWGTALVLACSGCGIVGLDVLPGDADGIGSGGASPVAPTGSTGGTTIGDGDATGGANASGGSDGTGAASSSGGSGVGGDLVGSGGHDGTGGFGTGGDGMGGAGTGGNDGTGGVGTGSGGSNGTGGSFPNTLIWHDFEDGVVPEKVDENGEASLEVKNTRAHGGDLSLVASQGPSATDSTTIIESFGTHIVTGTTYVRAWIYIASEALNGKFDVFRFGDEGSGFFDWGFDSTGRISVFISESGTTYSTPVSRFPTNEWFCFQSQIPLNPTSGSIRTSINGSIVMTTPAGDTFPGEGPDYFQYGIFDPSGGQINGLVTFDDLVVDDAPIACE